MSAVFIGLSFFLFGAAATANFFVQIPVFLMGSEANITGFDNSNIDGEFRFYSVFWIAYGLYLIHTVRNFDEKFRYVPILAGIFFLGGVGRLLSIADYGWPHPLFQILLFFEIVLPILMIFSWFMIRRSN